MVVSAELGPEEVKDFIFLRVCHVRRGGKSCRGHFVGVETTSRPHREGTGWVGQTNKRLTVLVARYQASVMQIAE